MFNNLDRLCTLVALSNAIRLFGIKTQKPFSPQKRCPCLSRSYLKNIVMYFRSMCDEIGKENEPILMCFFLKKILILYMFSRGGHP